tara:strand:+ start:1066 stop:1329 length:264 start_codon:yes stop_codon:yes gene_type:complete
MAMGITSGSGINLGTPRALSGHGDHHSHVAAELSGNARVRTVLALNFMPKSDDATKKTPQNPRLTNGGTNGIGIAIGNDRPAAERVF